MRKRQISEILLQLTEDQRQTIQHWLQVENSRKLAQKLYEFCPDMVD